MSDVASRIEKPQGYRCSVIALTEQEKDIYRGAGLKIARFEHGRLVELFNPSAVELPGEVWRDAEAAANLALQAALTWLQTASGETWLVMCSGYELCDPRPIAFHDAAAIARLARMLGDSYADNFI